MLTSFCISYEIEEYYVDTSKSWISNFLEVLNLNQLFLKFNQSICDEAVSSPRSLVPHMPIISFKLETSS